MVTCSVCHAWQPSKWDGSKWADDEAPCRYTTHSTYPIGTCSKASIVEPREVANASKPSKTIQPQQQTKSVCVRNTKELYAIRLYIVCQKYMQTYWHEQNF
jgi:hypothetical protein